MKNLYTFVIITPMAVVADFGCYLSHAVARGTAVDSVFYKPGVNVSIVAHDTDGSSAQVESWIVPTPGYTSISIVPDCELNCTCIACTAAKGDWLPG